LAAAGLAVAVPLAFAFPAPGVRAGSSAEEMPAQQVARLFIYRAVERRGPQRAWDLVTAAIRVRTSRSEWNSGTMRIVPVLSPTPLLVRLRTLERGPHRLLLLAGLRRVHALAGDEDLFLIRLVEQHRRWLVAYWGPAMLIGAPYGVPRAVHVRPADKA
jgi:hypothetical protein